MAKMSNKQATGNGVICDQNDVDIAAPLRKKKRKLKKSELKTKAVEAIPLKERWWSVWGCDASHTVASVVAEQLNVRRDTSTPEVEIPVQEQSVSFRDETEEIWSMRKFDLAMRLWMKSNKDAKCVNPFIFSR